MSIGTWEMIRYEREAAIYEALPEQDTTLRNQSRFETFKQNAIKQREQLPDRYLRESVHRDYEAYKAERDAMNCPDAVAGEFTVSQKDLLKLLKEAKKLAVTAKQRKDTNNQQKYYDDLLQSVKLTARHENALNDTLTATVMTIGETSFKPVSVEYTPETSTCQNFEAILPLKTLLELVALLPEGDLVIQYRWMVNKISIRYARGRARLNTLRWL